METILVNNELSASIPDGFRMMDAAETKAAFGIDNPDMIALKDADRHIVLNIAWHNSNKLIAGLASTKSLAERVEKSLSKTYRNAGYKLEGYRQLELCGEQAVGFTCTYTMQGVPQTADIALFKHGASCYTIYSYMRTDSLAEARGIVDGVLSSLRIG